MALAARAHAADRGADTRGIPLFAFGGAGPVHACRVAELLESSLIIFPPQASVLSAVGALVSPPRLDLVRSMVGRIDQLDWDAVDHQIGEMITHANAALAEAGCRRTDINLQFAADLRYQGQQYELTIALGEDPRCTKDHHIIRAKFEQAYKLTYGVELPDIAVEIVNWRLVASGRHSDLGDQQSAVTVPAKPKNFRKTTLSKKPVPVWDRHALAKGQVVQGPCLIEERETTTVLSAGWRAELDNAGSIIARLG
jgi:N-methylhydantoinase A